jgi:DHA2 family multidrug resistance protein
MPSSISGTLWPVPTVEYGLRRWIIVIGVLMAPLMETIDSSIINVALPNIQGNLGATLDEAAWAVTGYLAANVIVIPLTPWLQERFGRRQYFLATTIGFTVASVLCGLCGSIAALVALRIVQGLFGGGLIATAQSALRDLFPPEEMAISQGVFVLIIVVGPILAPVLGGAIVDNLSWQWIFFVNVVPGSISAIIVGSMLRNPAEPKALRVDALGVVLLAVGIGSLQYLLDEGERHDWFSSQAIAVAAALAVLGLLSFILWELYGAREPIVDLRILARYRSVPIGLVLAMGTSASFFGTTLVLPQFVQTILGFTAFESGQLQLFRALPVFFLVPVVAGLAGTGRLDARVVISAGWVLTAVSSFWLFARMTSDSDFVHFIVPLLVGGAGSAMLAVPLLIIIQGTTNAADGPKASAFITLAFQLGGSLAGAVLVTIIDRRAAFHLDALASSITLGRTAVPDEPSRSWLIRAFAFVAQQAQTMAFADTAFLVGAMAVALMLLVPLLKRQPKDMTNVLEA